MGRTAHRRQPPLHRAVRRRGRRPRLHFRLAMDVRSEAKQGVRAVQHSDEPARPGEALDALRGEQEVSTAVAEERIFPRSPLRAAREMRQELEAIKKRIDIALGELGLDDEPTARGWERIAEHVLTVSV